MANRSPPRRRRAGVPADILLVARAEWRGRWRSHLVVMGTTALTVACGLAALMAAGRAASADERLREETKAGDVIFYGSESRTITVEDVLSLDGVEAAAADEVVLSEPLAASIKAAVGDRIVLESTTAEWVETAFSGGDPGPPDGPEVTARVVGLARSPGDFGRYKGLLYLAPAYVERYSAVVNTYHGVTARLSRDGLTRIEAGEPPALEGAEVGPSPFTTDDSISDGLRTVAVSLRLVAAVGPWLVLLPPHWPSPASRVLPCGTARPSPLWAGPRDGWPVPAW
jgi:hypothetical protein